MNTEKTGQANFRYFPSQFILLPQTKEHKVAVCPSACPFCLEHNLKTRGYNLFKLHTVVEGIEA
jgi:hypothetical protein